jgi:hypothetical protein
MPQPTADPDTDSAATERADETPDGFGRPKLPAVPADRNLRRRFTEGAAPRLRRAAPSVVTFGGGAATSVLLAGAAVTAFPTMTAAEVLASLGVAWLLTVVASWLASRRASTRTDGQ